MDPQTTKFLQLFNALEGALKASLNRDNYSSFSKLIAEESKRDLYIKRHKDVLDKINTLRNVLVHEEGNVIIAVPTEETLAILEKIVNRYIQPKLVYDLCNDKVESIKSIETLQIALSTMEKKGFSKLPVYEDGHCIGLLTGNMISRWLRKNLDHHIYLDDLLKMTLTKDVMAYQKTKDLIKMIPRSINVNEFITLVVKEPSPSGVYIMTEHGSASEKPISIITSSDFPLLYGD